MSRRRRAELDGGRSELSAAEGGTIRGRRPMRLLKRREEQEPEVDDWTEMCRDTSPVADVQWRSRAKVAGRVRSLRVQPWAGVPTLEGTLVDDTGGISVVFLGRRHVPGIRPGTKMVVEGMVGDHAGRLAILNPSYRLLAVHE